MKITIKTTPDINRLMRHAVQRNRLRAAGLPIKTTVQQDIAAVEVARFFQGQLTQLAMSHALRVCARGAS